MAQCVCVAASAAKHACIGSSPAQLVRFCVLMCVGCIALHALSGGSSSSNAMQRQRLVFVYSCKGCSAGFASHVQENCAQGGLGV
jgi:hypothetical protein